MGAPTDPSNCRVIARAAACAEHTRPLRCAAPSTVPRASFPAIYIGALCGVSFQPTASVHTANTVARGLGPSRWP